MMAGAYQWRGNVTLTMIALMEMMRASVRQVYKSQVHILRMFQVCKFLGLVVSQLRINFIIISGITTKTSQRSKLAIPLSVDLWSISNIRENDETFKVKFKLDMKWNDSRLTFINLKEDEFQNIIPPQEAEKIWLPPPVMFLNTDNLDKATVRDNLSK